MSHLKGWAHPRQTDRKSEIKKLKITNTKTDKQTDRETDRKTDRQTERQTDRQTDKQTIRQTYKYLKDSAHPWQCRHRGG